MREEAQGISAANRSERYPNGFDERLVRTSLSFAQEDSLYLQEGFFNGREVRRLGR